MGLFFSIDLLFWYILFAKTLISSTKLSFQGMIYGFCFFWAENQFDIMFFEPCVSILAVDVDSLSACVSRFAFWKESKFLSGSVLEWVGRKMSQILYIIYDVPSNWTMFGIRRWGWEVIRFVLGRGDQPRINDTVLKSVRFVRLYIIYMVIIYNIKRCPDCFLDLPTLEAGPIILTPSVLLFVQSVGLLLLSYCIP